MQRENIHIIIVAAGKGSRFGSDLPKQYCLLQGIPVLVHTIRRFRNALPNAQIYTVVSHEMRDFWIELAAKFNCEQGNIIEGGCSRWESVKNALQEIGRRTGTDGIVLVHDGARPLVDNATIHRVVDNVAQGSSVVPVVPVTDSLRLVDSYTGKSSAVDRADYRAVVTPQGFMIDDLMKSYRLPFSTSFTDDASVMSAAGFTDSILVESSTANIKITNPGDIALASWYLETGF